MPLEAVIASVTANAAAAIGQSGELGTLRVGSVGDAAVLHLQEGDYTYVDAAQNQVQAGQQLTSVLTVKDGKRWRQPVAPVS
jgi:dihydroorotase